MNTSTGSGGSGIHRYRKNIVYRSLRRSSSQIVTTIKKKINDAEKSVRYRRTLRPLNESRSPSPIPQMRILAHLPANCKNVYSTPKATKVDLTRYEFDRDSNILRTPGHASTPRVQRKMGVIAHLREMAILRPLKKRPQQNDSAVETRLAKQLARTRIREIQSPRKRLLSSTACGVDRDGHPLPVKRS